MYFAWKTTILPNSENDKKVGRRKLGKRIPIFGADPRKIQEL